MSDFASLVQRTRLYFKTLLSGKAQVALDEYELERAAIVLRGLHAEPWLIAIDLQLPRLCPNRRVRLGERR